MSTLVVDGYLNARTSSLSDITDIAMANNGYLQINAAQFDNVQVSGSVSFTSDSSQSGVWLYLDTLHSFSAAGFQFANWTGNDYLTLVGTADADTITGSSDDDIFVGAGGGDSLAGGIGGDVFEYYDSVVADRVDGGDGVDVLRATGGSSNLIFSSFTSIEIVDLWFDASLTLSAGQLDGVSLIRGDWRFPTMSNTLTITGSDINMLGIRFETWDKGVDQLVLTGTSTTQNIIYGSRVPDLVNGNSGNDNLVGFGDNDTIYGKNGLDTIDGGTGDDYLDGGDLVDQVSYIQSSTGTGGIGVTVSLAIAGPQDTGRGGIDTLVNFENLTGSFENDSLTGNDAGNAISGGPGSDTIDGGAGPDNLNGNSGDDTYLLNEVHLIEIVVEQGRFPGLDRYTYDAVTETDFGGVDTVRVLPVPNGTGYALPANVENGIVAGPGAFVLTGNELANILTGNDSSNSLNGGANVDIMIGGGGDDAYVVDNAEDVVVEAANQGSDSVSAGISYRLGTVAAVETLQTTDQTAATAINLVGNDISQSLYGNEGINVLNGLAGYDTMTGFGGNDTYFVDTSLDRVVEAAGGGTDAIQSSVTLTLQAEVENLFLIGTAVISATGNAAANRLNGNAAANVLNGLAGADTLTGGAGNDLYAVDNGGDRTVEALNAGTDKVVSSVSWRLSDNIEYLTLAGGTVINGVGNALANQMTGNQSANLLNGLTGADTMTGLGGNDTYIVDNALDQIHEAANGGIDTVNATVNRTLGANEENLQLFGSATNGTGNDLGNRLTGNGGVNLLSGLAGEDVMTGGLGADRLNGGLGHDIFDYNAIAESGVTAASRDMITGFVQSGVSRDHIDLFSIDAKAGTAGNNAFAFIGTAGFTAEGQIRFGFSGNQTIVQINTTGTSVAEATIAIAGNLTLTAVDFFL